mmetsp:Transcript_6288/g.11668  ORF Transcript_6288/g.11668 Transcript_6288/m.11668 type:complete len:184 (+) Transcript_6288:70-621(+)|eukprot:CAMPEP_0172704994 /NCGR_PEP_ID=MMETSP1074-20121228/42064_1 /TAXON_ID=2916 /ORGANISM="Ceratium fusus, Strain PA161109" /LENGTH=183 /DNA_ID=CAMNT_0013527253 /DNA_START=65 /DNA_END=616 /DNA_ORIENTATION=+
MQLPAAVVTRAALVILVLQPLHIQLGADAKLQRRVSDKESDSQKLYLDLHGTHDPGTNVTEQQTLVEKAVNSFPGDTIKNKVKSKLDSLREKKREALQPERHHKGEVPEQFKDYIHQYEKHLDGGKPVRESQKLAAKAVLDKQHTVRQRRVGPFPAVAIALILAVPVGFSIGGTVCYAKTNSA